MKLIAPLLAAFMAFTSGVTADSYPDGAACLVNHPNLYTAINQFCAKNDIVIPSAYANAGSSHNGKWVGVRGTCNPKQWLPQQYCVSQLQTVCARAPANANNQMKFGRNGCQTFVTWTLG